MADTQLDTTCTCKNDRVRLGGERDASDHLAICPAHPNHYDACSNCPHIRGRHAIWMWSRDHSAGCFGEGKHKCNCPGFGRERGLADGH